MVAQIDKYYFKLRPKKALVRLLTYSLFEGRPLTTKGRWINPLVFSISASAKRLPISNRVKKPIFIVGTGRSGTTILGVILSIHNDIGFLNEPKAIWHSVVGYEDLVGSYSQKKALYKLTESDATPKVIESLNRIYSFYLKLTGSRRICDKYPELIFRIPFVKAVFPDAKFLFLVRNGWDTCSSIDKWSDRLGIQDRDNVYDWWGINGRKWDLLVEQVVPGHSDLAEFSERIRNFDREIDKAAVEWILSMREGIYWRNMFPDSFHTVIFEKLLEEPIAELQSIRDFCELGDDPVFSKYAIKTLHPVPSKEPFTIDPCISEPFNQMMKDLGYS